MEDKKQHNDKKKRSEVVSFTLSLSLASRSTREPYKEKRHLILPLINNQMSSTEKNPEVLHI